MSVKERLHALVEGRVQGVGFRYSVQSRARRLSLGGWVRNLPDGRVECVAEGAPEKLRELEAYLREGPPGARVEAVKVDWEAAAGDLREFGVR